MTDTTPLSPQDVPDAIVQEVVKELRAINVDEDAIVISCMCGGHQKTLRKLIADVEQRTPEGMRLIEAHIELQKRVVRFGKKKPWWKPW